MLKYLSKSLSLIIVCVTAIFLCTQTVYADDAPSGGNAGLPSNLSGQDSGDIGDYGSWATEHNFTSFKSTIVQDLDKFKPADVTQQVENYVPIEAKLGLAFMNGLSYVAKILDRSLFRFVTIFLVVGYLFWIMAEAYNMMTKGTDARKLAEEVLKKGAFIAIWLIILNNNPAQIFMWVMGPILTIGTYMADIILNAIANASGAVLPDTCNAIRTYAASHVSPDMLINPQSAADIMCLPTRLSGFFTTAIAIGFKWMLIGIGTSAFVFLIGLIFVGVFLYCAYKFTLVALGVIADLFLAIFMLPFTAISETLAKTSYKGIPGTILNGFLGMFKTQSLQDQIVRFIKATIYFVSLSIVIAVCAALLAGTFGTDIAAQVPTLDNNDFLIPLLTGILTAYLAIKADSIAKDIGGNIDDSLGRQFGNDIKTLWQNTWKTTKKWTKIIREGKKSS